MVSHLWATSVEFRNIPPVDMIMCKSCVNYFECSISGGKLSDCDWYGNHLAITFKFVQIVIDTLMIIQQKLIEN